MYTPLVSQVGWGLNVGQHEGTFNQWTNHAQDLVGQNIVLCTQELSPARAQFPEIYEQFGGAWNAVAYRFFAVAEYSATLSKSLAASAGPPPLEGSRQNAIC